MTTAVETVSPLAFGLVGEPHTLPGLPGWMTIVVASVLALVLIRRAFPPIITDSSFTARPNIKGEILELLVIAGAASALITTPLVSSAVTLVQNFEASFSTSGQVTAGVVAVIVVIMVGAAYIYTDSEWWALGFAIAVLAAGSQPGTYQLLTWIVEWPISYLWRGFLTFVEFVFNLSLT